MCGQVIKQSVVLLHTIYNLHTMTVTGTYCESKNTNVNSTETQTAKYVHRMLQKCQVQANNDVHFKFLVSRMDNVWNVYLLL